MTIFFKVGHKSYFLLKLQSNCLNGSFISDSFHNINMSEIILSTGNVFSMRDLAQ